jgi:predicted nucleic acid-binding protein
LRACYLDASALVKLATREPETDALRDHLELYAMRMTSRLSHVEVSRALLRGADAGAASVDPFGSVLRHLSIIELDATVADRAGGIEPATIRSLDAIHLASALSVADELDAFVTYDIRLADAARHAGLTVVAPA